MQTSEYLIAYQTVSASAYRRLRDTLLQQSSAFDSVEQAESFVLMRSSALDVLLLATQISDSYRVGLTFDEHAIAVFTQRLRSGRTQSSHSQAGRSQADPSQPSQLRVEQLRADQLRPELPHISDPLNHAFPFMGMESEDAGTDGAAKNNRTVQKMTAQKIMAQKKFVLGWAKVLAVSPEGDAQPTQTALDNQLQQSLLLDQVITRIRHSLDLPAILETTVAQVREFLSADRLVLYQFDQFELTEDAAQGVAQHTGAVPSYSGDHTAGTDSFSEEMLRHAAMSNAAISNAAMSPAREQSEPKGRSEGRAIASLVRDSHSESDETPQIGRFAHAGHVTYESRVSDDIPTVLHLTEEKCFSPSQSQRRARYLLGQPIAVDNVDETYQDVACLLDFLHQANVKSKIIAPIIVQDQVWGLLVAHQCHTYRHWEKSEAIFLQHIAEHLAVAISQASLYQQLRQQTVSLESCVIERTQSLHDALRAAELANLSKDEFLSTMSHELRTPLTYIIGMSATLLRWSLGDLNEQQRSYIKTINQSGEQLLKVINDILEFASVESGRSLLNASELPLKTFIEQVVANYQLMASKQEVSLCLNFETVPGDLIEADDKRLRQILGNLIHNAIKFTAAGGEVCVRVWREGQFVVFQIEDTGIGIPESQRDELFQKFKQLEPPFQRQYSGTGLGLAMTKRLVELHGGTIQVHSKVAEGSTFIVRLPATSQVSELLRKQSQSLEQALETTPKRVILLEEDEDNAAIACEMLTAAGYEIIWLVESDHLADQISSLKPALLIADLSMLSPELSNLKAIQHTITALDTKVLAISAEKTFDRLAMAHHDLLHKPLDPKALLGKVKQLA